MGYMQYGLWVICSMDYGLYAVWTMGYMQYGLWVICSMDYGYSVFISISNVWERFASCFGA